jgi:hypothetical protein
VIRTFHPEVGVARFSGNQPRMDMDTTKLLRIRAQEAYQAVPSPIAFPEQIKDG